MSDVAVAGAGGATRVVTMVGRCVRLSRRDVDALITALVLPIMLMLLFVYLFGGAIETGTSYVTYVVPGVILLCAGFGAGSTAVSICQDLTGGVMDRLRSVGVGGPALLIGHVSASVTRNLASTALVLGVAVAIGFRPHAGLAGWLGALGVLVAFIIAISSVAAAFGMLARTPEAANGFSFLVAFLPYPSSAFVPIDTMPTWLQGFARNQPITPVTESIRGLLLGTPVGSNPWRALAWCAAIVAGSVLVSAFLFRRRTR
jgi:ABC-2 type transport system permease protein